MNRDWKRFCQSKEYSVDSNSIIVSLGDNRKHKVTVLEEADAYRLVARVVRRSMASEWHDLALRAWLRNRETHLVGFRIGKEGHLIAEAKVPFPGLTQEEFRLCLETLAIEADRFEFALTGKDKE